MNTVRSIGTFVVTNFCSYVRECINVDKLKHVIKEADADKCRADSIRQGRSVHVNRVSHVRPANTLKSEKLKVLSHSRGSVILHTTGTQQNRLDKMHR
jgi:hypothetical protein